MASFVIPAEAGIQITTVKTLGTWMPAFAGMTDWRNGFQSMNVLFLLA
ncbi:MAG: hypothetical protein PVJ69_11995 [Desulfobacteraceae bacterium]|jgi:predicted secreted protein